MFQCPLGLELLRRLRRFLVRTTMFQCPLGLIPHFYILTILQVRFVWISVNALSGLYLISTYKPSSLCGKAAYCVNALSGLYLISTKDDGRPLPKWMIEVSMPSRAYTSFLRYPLKNLGFMRFPEPVFAGIYQNILTTAVFRAC